MGREEGELSVRTSKFHRSWEARVGVGTVQLCVTNKPM